MLAVDFWLILHTPAYCRIPMERNTLCGRFGFEFFSAPTENVPQIQQDACLQSAMRRVIAQYNSSTSISSNTATLLLSERSIVFVFVIKLFPRLFYQKRCEISCITVSNACKNEMS